MVSVPIIIALLAGAAHAEYIAPPSSLQVQVIRYESTAGMNYVKFTWADNSNNESDFELFYGTSADSLTSFRELDGNTISYNWTNPPSDWYGKRIYFKIRAVKWPYPKQESAFSSTVSVFVHPKDFTSDLQAVPNSSRGISLSWDTYPYMYYDGPNTYYVERDLSIIKSTTNTNFLDNTLSPGSYYGYRIWVVDSDGERVSRGEYKTCYTYVDPPQLTLDSKTDTSISVSWVQTQHSLDTRVEIIGPNRSDSYTYDKTGHAGFGRLLPNATYTVHAYGININNQENPNPSTLTVKTNPPPPSAPASASAAPYSTSAGQVGKIVISWSAAQYAESYEIYYSAVGSSSGFPDPDDPNDPLKNQKITAATATCDHIGVAGNTHYYYRIYSKNVTGRSAAYTQCDAISYNTRPGSPSGLSVTIPGSYPNPKRLSLSWTDASNNEDKFEIERSNDGGSHWAYLAETNANTPAYNDDTVIPGTTYVYRVRAHCPGTVYGGAANNYSNYCGPATRMAPQTAPTEAVSTPAFVSSTQASITLRWDPDTVDNITSYNIEYSTTSANPPNWLPAGTTTADTTAFTHTGLTPDTPYYYHVAAVNSAGTGPYSPMTASFKTLKTLPLAPAALEVTTDTGTLAPALDLRWTDNADNEDGFKIWRRTTNSGWPDPSTSTPDIIVSSRTGTGQTPGSGPYVDSSASLQYSTTYYYRVYAYNSSGVSAGCAEILPPETAVSTANPPPAAPAITTLQKQASPPAIIINWSWSQGTGGPAGGFKIYKSTTGADGSFTDIGVNIGPTLGTYTDAAVQPEAKYYYKVGAQDAVRGIYILSAGRDATIYIPPPPTNLMAQQLDPATTLPDTTPETPTIALVWTDQSAHETGFVIERSSDNGIHWTEIGTAGSNVTSYLDIDNDGANNLEIDTPYKYRVKGRGIDGDSGYSNIESIHTQNVKPNPATGLSLEIISCSRIKLSFCDNSANEDGFRVERTGDISGVPDAGGWTAITQAPNHMPRHEGVSIPGNTSTYVAYDDMACSPDTAYHYRVISFNEKGDAVSPSNTASGRTLQAAIDREPGNITAQPLSRFAVRLGWTMDQSAAVVDGFIIERSIDDANHFSFLKNITSERGNAAVEVPYTYDDTTCETDTKYYYRIIAYNSAGPGNPSASANAVTDKNPPTTPWKLDLKNQFLDLSAAAAAELKIYNRSAEQPLNWEIENKCRNVMSITQTSGTLNANGEISLTVTKIGSSFSPDESDYIKIYNADDPADCQYAQVYLGGGTSTITVTEPQSVIAGTEYNVSFSDSQAGKSHYVYYSPDSGYNYVMISNPTVDPGANSLPWTLKDAYLDASKDIPNDNHYKIRVASDTDCADNIYTFAVGNPMNLMARSSLTELPITLTWQDTGGNDYWTGYEIWEKQSADHTSYELITTWPAVNGAEDYVFTDTGQWQSLSPAKTNYYKVRAYKDGTAEYSAYSNVAFAKPQSPYSELLPSQPLNINATAGTKSVTLSWQDSQNETGYDVYRKTSLTGAWTWLTGPPPKQSLAGGTTTYTDTNLTAGTLYYYRIKAKNEAGEAYSEIAAARPLSPYTINLTTTGTVSIQDAVDSAQGGDIILLGEGVYTLPADVIISNKAITLKGNNAYTTVIDAGNVNTAFVIEGSSDVTLENIRIKHSISTAVLVEGPYAKAAIDHCVIDRSSLYGIHALGGAELTLTNSILHHNDMATLCVEGADTNAVIKNNVIAHNCEQGIIVEGVATASIENNIVAYNGSGGICGTSPSITIKKNAVWHNGQGEGSYFPSNYLTPSVAIDSTNISAEPGFINAWDPSWEAGESNYSLEYDSILLRKGIGVIPAYNEVPGTGNVLTGLFDSQNVHIADIMTDNTLLIYHYSSNGTLEGTVRALTVGSEDSSHTSIQDAVNSAQDKDTILVSSGTYNETIKIENKSLRIIGEGEDKTIINAQSLKYGFHISNNTDVTLANIAVTNASSYNIYIGPWSYYTTTIVRLNHVLLEGSNYGIGGVLMNGPDVYHPVCSYVTIDNSKIRYATKTGIELGFDTFRYQTLNENIIRPEYDISIHNTELTNNQRAISVSGYRRSIEITHSVIANNYSGGGIRLYSDANPYNLLKAYLNYNIISNNTGYGIWLGPTAQAYLNDNVLYSNTQGSIYQYSYNTLHPYLENIEPIDKDPKFIDTSIREYGLKTDSPALKLNTSTLDEDCGLVR